MYDGVCLMGYGLVIVGDGLWEPLTLQISKKAVFEAGDWCG